MELMFFTYHLTASWALAHWASLSVIAWKNIIPAFAQCNQVSQLADIYRLLIVQCFCQSTLIILNGHVSPQSTASLVINLHGDKCCNKPQLLTTFNCSYCSYLIFFLCCLAKLYLSIYSSFSSQILISWSDKLIEYFCISFLSYKWAFA